MSERIHSYSKIWNLGHPEVKDLFQDESGRLRVVRVEEKVDGSQFSFSKDSEGIVHFRSKGAQVFPESAGMFKRGVDHILSVANKLRTNFVYRTEYLQKPKHNTLAYERVPLNHLVLYDVEVAPYVFANRDDLEFFANEIMIDVIPEIMFGTVEIAESLRELLGRKSFLGGADIEGIVIKPIVPYFGRDGKAIMGKFVSEAFKERHTGEWKKANPGNGDILSKILEGLRTERSWEKAVEHLRDAGELENSPRDIGKIIREVQKDVFAESEAEIKEALFKWAKKNLTSKIAGGIPEWYKSRLLESQFEKAEEQSPDLAGRGSSSVESA